MAKLCYAPGWDFRELRIGRGVWSGLYIPPQRAATNAIPTIDS